MLKLIRDVNTIEYLPELIKNLREIQHITTVEDQELILTSEDIERVKNNQFIMSTDCIGISKFEKLLSITSIKSESLENRQLKVLSKWNDSIPYTYKWLEQKLNGLYGEGNYIISPDFDSYRLDIIIFNAKIGQIEYLVKALEQYVPSNIVYVVTKENETIDNIYLFNILKIRKETKVSRKGLITGVGGEFYTVAVIRTIKTIKIGMRSGVYGKL